MGDLSPNSQRQFAAIYDLTQRVNAKYHAIYCFYSVLSVNSVVNCFFQVKSPAIHNNTLTDGDTP